MSTAETWRFPTREEAQKDLALTLPRVLKEAPVSANVMVFRLLFEPLISLSPEQRRAFFEEYDDKFRLLSHPTLQRRMGRLFMREFNLSRKVICQALGGTDEQTKQSLEPVSLGFITEETFDYLETLVAIVVLLDEKVPTLIGDLQRFSRQAGIVEDGSGYYKILEKNPGESDIM